MLASESWQSLEKFRQAEFRGMLFAFLGTKGNMSRSLINFIGKPGGSSQRTVWYTCVKHLRRFMHARMSTRAAALIAERQEGRSETLPRNFLVRDETRTRHTERAVTGCGQ